MAQQAQQGQADNANGPLWAVGGIFVVFLLVWYFEHGLIVKIIFTIKLFEIHIVNLFSNSLQPVQAFIQRTSPATVSFMQVAKVCEVVGKKISIPITVVFFIMAFFLYKGSVKNRFRTVHSMQSLSEQEQKNWPYIVPVLGINLLDESINEGAWAMALPPMQFAKKNKLLQEEPLTGERTVLARHLRVTVKIRRGRANRVFARQLGQPWEGVWKLPPYLRALFAIFAAKVEGDRVPAVALLRQIAGSAYKHPIKPEHLNFKGADELLKKHEKSKVVAKVLNQHAYVMTVMASMLEVARLDGVLASAEFLWLKPVDRTLWYVLNTVGRQTAPCEIAGIIAHWLAERALGRAMLIPMIEEASLALESAIAELIYIPEEV